MRLIDADGLEKDFRHEYEQAYQKFHAAKREDEKTEYGAASVAWLQAIFRVRDAPTVDAVEVVRCKYCVWYENGKEYAPYCDNPCSELQHPNDDIFCSYGEGREDS